METVTVMENSGSVDVKVMLISGALSAPVELLLSTLSRTAIGKVSFTAS